MDTPATLPTDSCITESSDLPPGCTAPVPLSLSPNYYQDSDESIILFPDDNENDYILDQKMIVPDDFLLEHV